MHACVCVCPSVSVCLSEFRLSAGAWGRPEEGISVPGAGDSLEAQSLQTRVLALHLCVLQEQGMLLIDESPTYLTL